MKSLSLPELRKFRDGTIVLVDANNKKFGHHSLTYYGLAKVFKFDTEVWIEPINSDELFTFSKKCDSFKVFKNYNLKYSFINSRL